MRLWIPALIVALLAAPSSGAQTDTALQVAVGSRVRDRTGGQHTFIGELPDARGDTLVIRGSVLALTSRRTVARFVRSHRHQSRATRQRATRDWLRVRRCRRLA